MKTKVLLYGAPGYMGQLTARYTTEARLPLVLAARSPDLTKLAETLGVEARIFDLADAALVRHQLTDVAVVVNLAGPFSRHEPPPDRSLYCHRYPLHRHCGRISRF